MDTTKTNTVFKGCRIEDATTIGMLKKNDF